ncbi:MAG: Fe-S-cluster containining protein [Lysobacterales bacterium]|jgi:Fe-S-cluster containining protein
MFDLLPQFVSSDFCLSCQGCCRFVDPQSQWRAKVSFEEVDNTRKDNFVMAQQIVDALDDQGFLNTQSTSEESICTFLCPKSNKCSIYKHRPTECSIYPLVLVKKDNVIDVALHLSCPFVQENNDLVGYDEYLANVKRFFEKEDVARFVNRNQHLARAYEGYSDEFENILSIKLDETDGDALYSQRALMEIALRKSTSEQSVYAFNNVFNWHKHFTFTFKSIDNFLCIFAHDGAGCFLYLAPIGVGFFPISVVHKCFNYMDEHNQNKSMSRMENVDEECLYIFNTHDYNVVEKEQEYIYERVDIANLSGNDYKSKRSDYNNFTKNNVYSYEVYDNAMKDECLDLYDSWATQRRQTHTDDIYVHMINEGRDVHKLILQQFKYLGIIGRVVKVDGVVRGYTFGYYLKQDTFCVLFETVDLNIKGLPTFIFSQFCQDKEVTPYTYINVMGDFGMPNIARVKASYRPVKQITSYVVSRREN